MNLVSPAWLQFHFLPFVHLLFPVLHLPLRFPLQVFWRQHQHSRITICNFMVAWGVIMGALFEKFAEWLGKYLDYCLEMWKIQMMNLIQFVSDQLLSFAQWILSLWPDGGQTSFPTLPSTPIGEVFVKFIGVLNWLFPISFIVQLGLWLASAMLAYLIIAPLARWAKLLN